MKELIKYLLDNMYIDFQGEITLETVRNLLREDDGREARQLLSKLIEEKGVDDMKWSVNGVGIGKREHHNFDLVLIINVGTRAGKASHHGKGKSAKKSLITNGTWAFAAQVLTHQGYVGLGTT